MNTTKTARNSHRTLDVLLFVYRNDGCQPKDVMQGVYKDVANRNYGRQSPAGFAIASLRRKGLLEDDCERCPHCQRAARGRRNTTLSITAAGKIAARKAIKDLKKTA